MSQANVFVAVGGGVAAYKALMVTSQLRQAGAIVNVAMTPAACQFVTPMSFAAVTSGEVLTELFPSASSPGDARFPHLFPARDATVCVIVPATANLIARAVHGLADDVVTTSFLALPGACRRFFCPSMNVEMWQQTVVQDNVSRLRDLGWTQLGPESGHQACGSHGIGRMVEADDIVAAVLAADVTNRVLRGRRLLILSGPTREHFDPVRYISNHSSGRMGQALALAAADAGAQVEFVSGPVADYRLPVSTAVTVHHVVSAAEMLACAERLFADVDAAICVAAVADFRPSESASEKRPKGETNLSVSLSATPDIAARLGTVKRGHQQCIGFALETSNELERARQKLTAKSLDAIVLNGVDSFGADSGHFTWLSGQVDAVEEWGALSKAECARRIVSNLSMMLSSQCSDNVL